MDNVTTAVWKLLVQIPVNKRLLTHIKTLNEVELVPQTEHNLSRQDQYLGWNHIVDSSSTYKMLYQLQVLNTLISVDQQKQSESEVQERFEWRQRFLELGGFNHLYGIFVQTDIDNLMSQGEYNELFANERDANLKSSNGKNAKKQHKSSKLLKTTLVRNGQNSNQISHDAQNSDKSQHRNDKARCMGFLLSIIKIFLQAALLTVDQERLLSLVAQSSTSPFRKSQKNTENVQENAISPGADSQSNTSKDDSSAASAHTAKFGGSGSGGASAPQTQKIEAQANQNQNKQTQQRLISQPSGTYTQVDDFPRLVDQMKQGDLACKLLEQVVDFEDLISKLLHIVYSTILHWGGDNASSDFAELLQHSMDLLLPCVVWKPDLLLRQIYEFEHLELILVRALMFNQNESVRSTVERTFRVICNSLSHLEGDLEPPKIHMLKLLLRNLPDNHTSSSLGMGECCEEYFSLTSLLIKLCGAEAFEASNLGDQILLNTSTENQSQFSGSALLNKVVTNIKLRPILESKGGIGTPDKVLSGYLQLAQAVLEVCPVLKKTAGQAPNIEAENSENHGLIQVLFDFLFLLPEMPNKLLKVDKEAAELSMKQPKCKTKSSRKKAFNLLLTLCQNCEVNYSCLLEKLFGFHKVMNDMQGQVSEKESLIAQLYSPTQNNSNSLGVRSSTGYAGLYNYGCTCYMNSLIQCLYMIPNLKEGILSADLTPDPEKEINDQNELMKVVPHEIQNIFANLQESEQQYYKPDGFVQKFQFQGEPVNVRQQQDTHEFFNCLCDNLDNCAETKGILKNTLTATIVTQTKSLESEYPYVGEREEPYLAIPLDIKNKKSIQEALDLFVKPDILEGDNKYRCDKHDDRLIDAQRRSLIGETGPTLVLHLKRFEFDFMTMTRTKVNDYCEFPELLDLTPWTREGVEKAAATGDQDASVNGDSDKVPSVNQKGQNRYSDSCSEDEDAAVDGILGDTSMQEDEGEAGIFDDEIMDEEILSEDQTQNAFETQIREDASSDQDRQVKSKGQRKNNQGKSIKKRKESINQGNGLLKQKSSKDQQPNKFLYRLSGILVHSGGANSGHYYSYIKERSGAERWLEFNDTRVSEFDFANLASKCFGTPVDGPKADAWHSHANAYLLFYEQVEQPAQSKSAEKQVDPQDEEMPQEITTTMKKQSSRMLIKGMDSSLYSRIWGENEAFVRLKVFYDFEYFQFLRDYINIFGKLSGEKQASAEDTLYFDKEHSQSNMQIKLANLTSQYFKAETEGTLASMSSHFMDQFNAITAAGDKAELDVYQMGSNQKVFQNLSHDAGLQTLKFATALSFDIALKLNDVQNFQSWMALLEGLYSRQPEACVWFIKYIIEGTKYQKTLIDLLLAHKSFEVRVSFATLVKTALNMTMMNEQSYLTEEDKYLEFTSSGTNQVCAPRSAVVRFMKFFIQMLDNSVRENWRNYEEYFDVLKDFTQSSFTASKLMISNLGAIGRLLEFIMNNKAPFHTSKPVKPTMGQNQVQPSLKEPLDLLQYLIRCTVTQGIQNSEIEPVSSIFKRQTGQVALPIEEIKPIILNQDCIFELLRRTTESMSDDAVQSLRSITEHLSWGEKEASHHILNHLFNYVKKQRRERRHLGISNAIMSNLLILQDGLQQQRCQFLFDFENQYENYTPFMNFIAQHAKVENNDNTQKELVVLSLNFVGQTADNSQILQQYLINNVESFGPWVAGFLTKMQAHFIQNGDIWHNFHKEVHQASHSFQSILKDTQTETFDLFCQKIEEGLKNGNAAAKVAVMQQTNAEVDAGVPVGLNTSFNAENLQKFNKGNKANSVGDLNDSMENQANSADSFGNEEIFQIGDEQMDQYNDDFDPIKNCNITPEQWQAWSKKGYGPNAGN